MHWRLVTLRGLEHGLLSGDRPLIRSNGIGRIDGFLVLPTSPTSYFIASVDKRTTIAFEGQSAKRIEKAINDAIVRQSEEFVISCDERQTRFIDNRLGDMRVNRDNLGDVTWNSPHKFEPWEINGFTKKI